MMLDISADHFCGDLVTHRAGKIPIFPEFPTPETPLDPWELTKDGPGTLALEPGHDLGDGVPWREGTKNVDMVRTHIHFLNGGVILLRTISKELPYPLLNFALQYVSPVLGRTDQVVEGIVDGVRCASEDHAAMVTRHAERGSGQQAHRHDRSFPPAAAAR
jgi:hypothetical protein